MSEKFVGRWRLDTTENFDEFMKALNVNLITRTMGAKLKPDLVFSNDGDTWKMRTESTFKTTEINFKLNEEFDEETADGRKVKTTMTLEGDNKLIQKQLGDINTTLTREIVDDDTLKLTCEVEGNDKATSVRVYKKNK